MARFIHLRLFVYLRLMRWKRLQGLFLIHIIDDLYNFLYMTGLRKIWRFSNKLHSSNSPPSMP